MPISTIPAFVLTAWPFQEGTDGKAWYRQHPDHNFWPFVDLFHLLPPKQASSDIPYLKMYDMPANKLDFPWEPAYFFLKSVSVKSQDIHFLLRWSADRADSSHLAPDADMLQSPFEAHSPPVHPRITAILPCHLTVHFCLIFSTHYMGNAWYRLHMGKNH